jgi:hypothetical protein
MRKRILQARESVVESGIHKTRVLRVVKGRMVESGSLHGERGRHHKDVEIEQGREYGTKGNEPVA